MADPSQAPSALDPRVQSDSILARLPVDLASLPSEVLSRVVERSRQPDRRVVIGRYVVTGEVGRGGMGVVYDAWDPGIERRVAIKTIEPDLVPEEDRDEVIERFRRETKIVGRLQHPGIVTIFDYGEERDQTGLGSRLYYYVMEYLEGQSLARVLRERRALPDVEAVHIVADVLEALQVSHSAGVIHRDIKPSNIFLRGGKRAVILDFGIAKTGSVALTRQGQILGTPSYLAPERLREKEVAVDGRADIFSLGVLLFTMLVGEAPFVGEDVYDVIDKIAKQSHPKLARSTPSGQALSRVIDKMLAKRPDDRYGDAAAAAEALREVERLLDAPAATPMEAHLVAGPRVREQMRDQAPETATEIGATSSAVTALSDEEDTGRHPVGAVRPRAASESMGAPPATPAEILGEPRLVERATELAASESPIRIADLLGTRPELALQRETRELRSGTPLPRAASLPAYSEGHEGPDSGEYLSGEYESHAPANDETTDDHTIADPEMARGAMGALAARRAGPAGRPPAPGARALSGPTPVATAKVPSGPVAVAARTPSKAPRAADDRGATEQIVRAASAEHSEQKTEQQERGRPNIRPGRAKEKPKRSRIEASLIDEDDVVVKPAPLDALKPDELPTQTGFRAPPSGDGPVAEDLPGAGVPDPAEPVGALSEREAGARPSRGELEPSGTPVPELDVPRSAAVARRTFGARGGAPAPMKQVQVKPGAPVQVRVSGPLSADGVRLVRQRGFVLLIAMLGAIAVGLFLGRMKQRAPAPAGEAPGEVARPVGDPARAVEPKVSRPSSEGASAEPELVKPRPASELIQDAAVALGEHNLSKAAELFEKATRAAPERSRLRGQAMLGRADALRQLGRRDAAIEVFRAVVAELPRTAEAEEARVALTELGASAEAASPRRDTAARPAAATTRPRESPPEPVAKDLPSEPAKTFDYARDLIDGMSADAKCRTIMEKLINAPDEAVTALQRLAQDEPRAACVHWHLGNSYGKLKEDRAAMTAYRRYLELRPDAENRAAVESRIKNLASKLEER